MARRSTSLARVFAKRTREVREQRGWTQRELAERLKDLGVGMHPTAVAKVESGARGVALDEVVALALALETSPLHLLTPTKAQDPIGLTPSLAVPASHLREWFRGYRLDRESGYEQDEQAFLSTLPEEAWAVERIEGLARLRAHVRAYISARVADDRTWARRWLTLLRREVERQQDAIDEQRGTRRGGR